MPSREQALSRASMSARRSGAGCSPPHGDLPSLVSPRERRPREGDPGPCVPCRLTAPRATCPARGMGALHNSHHSLRSFTSNRCNESDVEARDFARPPMPLRCSAQLQGWGGIGIAVLRAIAALGPGLCAAFEHAAPGCRAQRRPEWVPAPSPCARAEERSGMGGARASRASWTDSLHLSELSERSERCELCNAPMT